MNYFFIDELQCHYRLYSTAYEALSLVPEEKEYLVHSMQCLKYEEISSVCLHSSSKLQTVLELVFKISVIKLIVGICSWFKIFSNFALHYRPIHKSSAINSTVSPARSLQESNHDHKNCKKRTLIEIFDMTEKILWYLSRTTLSCTVSRKSIASLHNVFLVLSVHHQNRKALRQDIEVRSNVYCKIEIY